MADDNDSTKGQIGLFGWVVADDHKIKKQRQKDHGLAWRKRNPAKVRAQKHRQYAKIVADPEKKAKKNEYNRKQSARSRKENPEKGRKAKTASYRRTLEKKAGRPKPAGCEICGETRHRICFDHCHQSGKFRGWLCHHCNLVLAYSHDDTEVLRKLIEYLRVV